MPCLDTFAFCTHQVEITDIKKKHSRSLLLRFFFKTRIYKSLYVNVFFSSFVFSLPNCYIRPSSYKYEGFGQILAPMAARRYLLEIFIHECTRLLHIQCYMYISLDQVREALLVPDRGWAMAFMDLLFHKFR